MRAYPEIPTLNPKQSLEQISSSAFARGPKLLASSLVTQSRSFEYEMNDKEKLLVLDVTHFLNHRINTKLVAVVGEELAQTVSQFDPNIILTAPSSGNIPAIALALNIPSMPDVIYAPKGVPITMTDTYTTQSRSYTHGKQVPLVVAKDCLAPGARVVICDDFLDTGKTAIDLLEIVRSAGAVPVGFCFIIEKPFNGRELIKAQGFSDEQIVSLITIDSMLPGKIKLKGIDAWLSLVRQ